MKACEGAKQGRRLRERTESSTEDSYPLGESKLWVKAIWNKKTQNFEWSKRRAKAKMEERNKDNIGFHHPGLQVPEPTFYWVGFMEQG